ncbi:hypothetical protein [Streptomyces pristinaespiralis]|uniref:hypothetical protein n=1 Tax=Streptomyces pristinaespiralis TaxID=38300 RepID=UPI0038359310
MSSTTAVLPGPSMGAGSYGPGRPSTEPTGGALFARRARQESHRTAARSPPGARADGYAR